MKALAAQEGVCRPTVGLVKTTGVLTYTPNSLPPIALPALRQGYNWGLFLLVKWSGFD